MTKSGYKQDIDLHTRCAASPNWVWIWSQRCIRRPQTQKAENTRGFERTDDQIHINEDHQVSHVLPPYPSPS